MSAPDHPDAQRPGAAGAGIALGTAVLAALGAFFARERTLLPAGFFDALALAALGLGAAPLAHRAFGAPAATLARGMGIAGAALLTAGALVPPFDRAAPPLVAWILGASLLQAATRARRNAIVLGSIGAVLLALGCGLAWYGAAAWPEPARLRATVVGAASLAAMLLLGRFWVARHAPSLVPSPIGLVLGATLAATYVAYRPLVAPRVDNLPLYEWTIGVGVAVLLLGRLRRSVRDASVTEAWSGKARRHQQDAMPAYDARMPPLAAAIQRYLESGQGFEEYRAAMLRAAPHVAPPFRKALQGATSVPGKGRAGKNARAERLRVHEALMETMHGDPTPAVRAHP